MIYCRACGIASEWNAIDRWERNKSIYERYTLSAYDHKHIAHWECLCIHCNELYNEFWTTKRWGPYSHKHDLVRPDDQTLVEFLADRLRILVKLKQQGKSITRCNIILPQGHRCHFRTNAPDSGVCGMHARFVELGKTFLRADSTNDLEWHMLLRYSIPTEVIEELRGRHE